MKKALEQHPSDRDILAALINFNRDAGDIASALSYAERLAPLAPNDGTVTALVQTLRDQVKKQNAR